MDELRASDTDRERVVEQLRQAHDEGRLTLIEFDERVGAAWAARTYGELRPVTADLPEPARPSRAVQPTAQQRHRARLRPHGGHGSPVRAWATASVVNLVIWALVSLATLSLVYPWWIWVAGPWGVALLVRRLAERRSPAYRPGVFGAR